MNFIQDLRTLFRTFLLSNMTCNWHVLGHLGVNVFFPLERAYVSLSKHVDVLCFDAVKHVFVFFSWMWNRRARNGYFQYLFPDHPLLCVCICWSCWIPQNGATPLHMSAVERTLEECLNATVHLQSSPASLFLVTPWIASKYLLYLQASSSRQYTNRETTGSQQAGKARRDTLKQNTLQSSRIPSNEFTTERSRWYNV